MDESISTSNVLKRLCRNIYLISIGDFWYEHTYRPKWKEFLYQMYGNIATMIVYATIVNEFLEVIFNSFPEAQHRDALSYSIAHINIYFKLYLFKRAKPEIKEMLKELIDACHGYEDEELLKTQRRKIKWAIALQFIVIYFALLMYIFEGLRRMYFEGDIYISLITYWPFYGDRSTFAVIMRMLISPTIFFMMASMIFSESLIIAYVIIIASKFASLKIYFGNIRKEFITKLPVENIFVLREKLKNECLTGILMHRELLRLTRKVQKVFGVMIALQVCQTSAVATMVLLRLAFQHPKTLPNILMSLLFATALFIQLALYLWNTGDITFNAAFIPDAIFHCGWYMCPIEETSYTDIRRLVIMGCAQAQRPVILKAFGLQDLSHQTFAAVVRTTYSIFAFFH